MRIRELFRVGNGRRFWMGAALGLAACAPMDDGDRAAEVTARPASLLAAPASGPLRVEAEAAVGARDITIGAGPTVSVGATRPHAYLHLGRINFGDTFYQSFAARNLVAWGGGHVELWIDAPSAIGGRKVADLVLRGLGRVPNSTDQPKVDRAPMQSVRGSHDVYVVFNGDEPEGLGIPTRNRGFGLFDWFEMDPAPVRASFPRDFLSGMSASVSEGRVQLVNEGGAGTAYVGIGAVNLGVNELRSFRLDVASAHPGQRIQLWADAPWGPSGTLLGEVTVGAGWTSGAWREGPLTALPGLHMIYAVIPAGGPTMPAGAVMATLGDLELRTAAMSAASEGCADAAATAGAADAHCRWGVFGIDGTIPATCTTISGVRLDPTVATVTNAAVTWPGAVVRTTTATDGALALVPKARAAGEVFVTNVNNPNRCDLSRPGTPMNQSAVNAAVNDVLTSCPGLEPISDVDWKLEEGRSSTELSKKLNLGVDVLDRLGSSGKMSGNYTSHSHNVVVVLHQAFYRAHMGTKPTPQAFFAECLSPSFFDAKDPMAFVDAMDYGKLAIFKFSSNDSTIKEAVEAKIGFAKGKLTLGADADRRYTQIIENASVSYYVRGGSLPPSGSTPLAALTHALTPSRELTSGAPLNLSLKYLDGKQEPVCLDLARKFACADKWARLSFRMRDIDVVWNGGSGKHDVPYTIEIRTPAGTWNGAGSTGNISGTTDGNRYCLETTTLNGNTHDACSTVGIPVEFDMPRLVGQNVSVFFRARANAKQNERELPHTYVSSADTWSPLGLQEIEVQKSPSFAGQQMKARLHYTLDVSR